MGPAAGADRVDRKGRRHPVSRTDPMDPNGAFREPPVASEARVKSAGSADQADSADPVDSVDQTGIDEIGGHTGMAGMGGR
ncbi:hypothetical protein LAUMK7_01357 [Mycobacterium kansasii]|uniref:Uncharacterized protein n=3 Tax=Mycobacterium kansasii TaxID=1768 RepID=A0A653F522_MYCKA|nr:hypothetical protein MKANGN_40430 [Mycobacterium kansasii]VAZ58946.1 hypothetical protein LAUMK22_00738 [Mycobacterium kansasii]VAZ65358.1 hypothetical protein LAUMK40_01483 [Mycobacterium kansasii]VAZ72465.1 hypothetical protein LAUMK7_01357 [Mycobacterium kansasii]VTP04854.1 hypothetical protein BIN_B_04694 [Mycobacterium kansasii]